MEKNRLKELRKSRLLTQKELGDILNLDQTTISKLENYTQGFTPQTLIKAAEFFGVSTSYILGIEEPSLVASAKADPNLKPLRISLVITTEEEELIRRYRMLDNRDKEDILDSIDLKLQRQERRMAQDDKHA